jgi:hypothetical protein
MNIPGQYTEDVYKVQSWHRLAYIKTCWNDNMNDFQWDIYQCLCVGESWIEFKVHPTGV